jgi:hypothetical protein
MQSAKKNKIKTEVSNEDNRWFIYYIQKNTIRAHILVLNIFLINLQHILINANNHIPETFTSILYVKFLHYTVTQGVSLRLLVLVKQ